MIDTLFVDTGWGYRYVVVGMSIAFISFLACLLEEKEVIRRRAARTFFLSPVWPVFPVWFLGLLLRYLLQTAGWWPTKKKDEASK